MRIDRAENGGRHRASPSFRADHAGFLRRPGPGMVRRGTAIIAISALASMSLVPSAAADDPPTPGTAGSAQVLSQARAAAPLAALAAANGLNPFATVTGK